MYIQDKLQYDTKTKSVNLSRSGVYHYLGSELGINDNEVYSVYRPQSTVQKTKEIIDSLGTIPILINHPKEFVDLNNELHYKNGGVGNIEISDKDGVDYCIGDVIGLSDSIKGLMEKGQEVSLGFKAEISKSTNSEYDFEMKVTDVNHLAFVSNGRAGSECSIQDKANFKAIILDMLNINKKEKEMAKETVVKDTTEAVKTEEVVNDPAETAKVVEAEVEAPAKADVKVKDSVEVVDKAIIDKAFNDGFVKAKENFEQDFKDFNSLKESGIVCEINDSLGETVENAVLKVLDKESFENEAERKAGINLVISQAKKKSWNFQDMSQPKQEAKRGSISGEFFNK